MFRWWKTVEDHNYATIVLQAELQARNDVADYGALKD